MTEKQEKIKKILESVHYNDNFIFEARGDEAYFFRDKRFPDFKFIGNVPKRKLNNVKKIYHCVLSCCVAKGQVKICGTCKHCFEVYWQPHCKKRNYIYSELQIACEDWEFAE